MYVQQAFSALTGPITQLLVTVFTSLGKIVCIMLVTFHKRILLLLLLPVLSPLQQLQVTNNVISRKACSTISLQIAS